MKMKYVRGLYIIAYKSQQLEYFTVRPVSLIHKGCFQNIEPAAAEGDNQIVFTKLY